MAAPVTAATAAAQPTSPAVTEGRSQASHLSDAFADVAEHVSPSVVTIKVEAKHEQQVPQGMFGMPFFHGQGEAGQQGQQPLVRGSGSGVIFRADGAVLTNNHVVEHASRIDVVLKDGRSFRAKVAGSDPAVDLAVLKIDATGLPAASFADSAKARVGEWVLAIGAPFGLDYTLTAGVLSAKGRGIGANEIEDYLQTDASINPGNSGGPLVNLDGRVLGINTMIIGGSGIGFAIPGNLARQVGEQLLKSGAVQRAWLGVSFQELSPELAESLGKHDTHGALVSSVVPKGPAERAGIHAGDIIERVDQDDVVQGKDLLRDVLKKPVGSEVGLVVRRDGKLQTLTVKTEQRPGDTHAAHGAASDDGASEEHYGLRLQSLTPDIARELGYAGSGKVVISAVQPGSPAELAGLRAGDVVAEADHHGVQTTDDVSHALADGKVLLRVERRDGSFFTVLSKD
ncbi:MAG TPA: Do family serine endopeptidase [Polyangiales bacterium]